MWPKFLRTYFGFTKQQGRGLFVLVLMCALIVLFRILLPYFESEPTLVLKTLSGVPVEASLVDAENSDSSFRSPKHKTLAFDFNPNTINYEQLLQLGLKPSSAKALVNFRNRGFVFKKKSDFKKVYGISEQEYARLKPHILLDDELKLKEEKRITPDDSPPSHPKKEVAKIIEINSADSLSLLQLNGIGPVFAKRILKYRNLLGGFFDVKQLKEVYGIDEALFKRIEPFVQVNPELIQALAINSDDFKRLNKHPYLSYDITKQLVKARKNRKLDRSAFEDILNNDSLFQKLSPYCTFN